MGGAWLSLLMGMYIHAPGQCPAAVEIERWLAPLLPPAFASNGSDVAAIQEHGDGSLTLSLARFDHGSIIQRHLPPASSCVEQAETVAVALAIWVAPIQPPTSLGLDRPSAERPRLVTTRPPQPIPTVSEDRPRNEIDSRVLGVGAGLAGDWQSGSLVQGSRLEATLGRQRDGLTQPGRLRLSVVGLGEREIDLPPGRARWWRVYLAPGVDYALGLGPKLALRVGLAGVVGVMHVAGSGYAVDHQSFGADWGAEWLARIEWHRPHIHPWLGLAVVTWLRRQRLDIAGADGVSEMGRVEPMVAIGAELSSGTH